MRETRIGISGWRYRGWRGTFYPEGLAHGRELEFAAQHFNSIEINGSFYSLQQVHSWQRWYDQTPKGFLFSIKGSRYITHMRRLKEIEQPLANFFAQGILALKEKLGPILWQFPANFAFEAARFEQFFEMLPRNTHEALTLARRRDYRLKGRTYLRAPVDVALRHAVEIRHESFSSPEFLRMLRRQGIGLVIADTAGKWPFMEDLTADFVYVRLHGDKQIYVSGYSASALESWASRLRTWRRSRDVYVYFDNDVKVRAPFDAIALSKRLERAA
jgi:uncharacterized protein YecE (DUF72 family)